MRFTNTKIMILALLIVSSISTGLYAGPRTKLGTAAAPELLIPIGSVGTSLSGSNMSYMTGVESMYWNPAGISQITSDNTEVMFSHMNYIADMSMQTLGAVARVGNLGVIGASIRSFNIGEIMETSELEPEGTGNVFTPTYLVAGITFARQMTDKIRFGTTINLINEDVADVSATGFAFDFGIQYIGGASGFTFGLALKNLGPSMSFNGPGLDRTFIENGESTTRRVTLQEFDLPTNLELGVAYKLDLNKQNQIMLSSAFQNSGFSSDEYRFGLEYNFNNNFYVRGSYNYQANKEENEAVFGPSFGAGVKYPFGNLMVAFDYAYRIINEEGFDSTNQFFTLKLGF